MRSSSRGRALTLALVSPALLLLLAASLVWPALGYSSQVTAIGGGDEADAYTRWLEFKDFQRFEAWRRLQKHRSFYNAHHHHQRDHVGSFDSYRDDDAVVRGMQPPPVDQPARMARYIVNQAGWTSIATVSSRKDTETYPFVNIISFSDGPLGNGTGIPYMFLTPLDFTAQDVFKDDRATLMMTLAQGRYCESKNYDPMDPRCARVVFSGKIKEVKENNPEYPIAKSAIFGRHPWLAHMPKDHHFFFAKLKIGTIAVLDTFGGPKYVTLDDYLQPPKSDR